MNKPLLDNRDTVVPPAKSAPRKARNARRRRSPVLDFFLGFFGFSLAAFSLYLPFYVYIHSAEFKPPEMEFTGRLDADNQPPELEIPQQRRPLFREVRQSANSQQNVDTVVTGSINRDDEFAPDLRPVEPGGTDSAGLPVPVGGETAGVPVHKSLTLVFATSSRALIRDGARVDVRRGRPARWGTTRTPPARSRATWRRGRP